jgi:ABC-type xylose transport system permease subunit
LSAGWVLVIVITNLIDLAPGPIVTLVSFLVPAYLFFVPVQNYINSATQKKYPAQPYSGWSFGHVLCLVLGLAIWGFTIYGSQIDSFSFEQ